MVSLGHGAAQLIEALDLERQFNPFGDQREMHRLTVADDCPRQFAARVRIPELSDKWPRDLEDVDGKAAQVRERCVPGADIVDRHVSTRTL